MNRWVSCRVVDAQQLAVRGQNNISERMSMSYFPTTREYAQQYGLTLDHLKALDKQIIVMHPGPINRGVEITSAVADHPQAIILDQVQNGVAIRMAVIYLLAAKIK